MDSESEEDFDGVIDIDAAARFRQLLKGKVQDTLDPLHQSLMDLMMLGEPYGIDTIADFDDDISDIGGIDEW